MDNPFLSLEPREGEKTILIEEEKALIKEYAIKLSKGGKILMVLGAPGSGKSLIVKEIIKKIEKDVTIHEYSCNLDLINKLRNFPFELTLHKKFVIVIDKFELFEILDKEKQDKIAKLLYEIARNKVGIIVSSTKEFYKKFRKDYPKLENYIITFEMRPLTFEETKKLILSRLNETREVKSDDLSPFTEKEIKQIWEASKGNPRMVLLLCSMLYSEKMKK